MIIGSYYKSELSLQVQAHCPSNIKKKLGSKHGICEAKVFGYIVSGWYTLWA